MKGLKFGEAVVRIVREVPYGKVVSYGQVAAYMGMPRAARAVGWVLRGLDPGKLADVPWWRVVNNIGRISIKGNWYVDANIQRDLLRKEGVEVGEDYGLEMEKYRYVASEKEMTRWGLG